MPELPEVETVTRALRARLLGRSFKGVVQRRADLRFPLPSNLEVLLVGRRLVRITRRAKFVQAHLDDGQTLLLHLGMSGRLLFDGPSQGVHEHLTFAFDDRTILRFVDPRRFGMLDLYPTAVLAGHRWLRHLGLEPLSSAFTKEALHAALQARRVALKTALLDQRLVAGLGNIYANEALFRAGLAPARAVATLELPAIGILVTAVRTVLREAIDAGGSSLRDYVQASGELGSFQRNFQVYDRDRLPCFGCGGQVLRFVQAGRASFHCERCQR